MALLLLIATVTVHGGTAAFRACEACETGAFGDPGNWWIPDGKGEPTNQPFGSVPDTNDEIIIPQTEHCVVFGSHEVKRVVIHPEPLMGHAGILEIGLGGELTIKPGLSLGSNGRGAAQVIDGLILIKARSLFGGFGTLRLAGDVVLVGEGEILGLDEDVDPAHDEAQQARFEITASHTVTNQLQYGVGGYLRITSAGNGSPTFVNESLVVVDDSKNWPLTLDSGVTYADVGSAEWRASCAAIIVRQAVCLDGTIAILDGRISCYEDTETSGTFEVGAGCVYDVLVELHHDPDDDAEFRYATLDPSRSCEPTHVVTAGCEGTSVDTITEDIKRSDCFFGQ